MIHADDLSRRFGDVNVVDGVSFDVVEGEIFGLLGPNGAGKTTTNNMLCTLLRPSGGVASIAGFDVTRSRSDVRRSIGLVFQQTTLDGRLTACQNLRFHGFAYGMDRDVREAQIRRLLKMVELWDRRHDDVRDFSGGMKRRLEIARGLMHQPRVLFLDEPTLGLDPQTRRRIWEYLLELRASNNLTIFLTTHYMDEAEHCDRIAVIDEGRIVALDTPEALKSGVGGDIVSMSTPDAGALAAEAHRRYGVDPSIDGSIVRFSVRDGDSRLPELIRGFDRPIDSINLRRPTLDDVFLDLTGHEIRDGSERNHRRTA